MPKTKLLTYTGIGSAGLLASLPVFLTLGPVFSSASASAEEVASSTDASLVTATVNPALAISATPVSISATPSIGNTFVTGTSTVKVTNTGSSGGYHLTMSSDNGGALKNGSNAIPTFAGTYSKTGNSMKAADDSSWGYTTETVQNATNDPNDLGRTFYPIPTDSTAWAETKDSANNKYAYLAKTTGYTNTSGDTIKVGYGFSISPKASAGAYTNTVTYTVYADEDMRNTIFDMTNMQDLAAYDNACKNTPTPAVSATEDMATLTASIRAEGVDTVPAKSLKDTRDDNMYTVKKLADGNCWMTDNLKLGRDTEMTLTPSDSHVTRDWNLPASSATGFSNNAAANIYLDESEDDYGGYYTYAAATANANPSSGNATEDICPRGWRLPSKSEYESLVSDYSWSESNSILEAPFKALITGYYHSSKLVEMNQHGYFWTSTATGKETAHNLAYEASSARVSNSHKFAGSSVRCIFGS